MKKPAVLIAFTLLLAAGTSPLAHAAMSTAATHLYVDCYSFPVGQGDGTAARLALAAQYGVGTTEYTDALNAAIEEGMYLAKTTECPIYWRGYVYGLRN